MSEFRPEEGKFNLGEVRIAVIAARWNAEITDGLLNGAVRALARHNISGAAVEEYRVPGAFELPLAAQRAARTGRFVYLLKQYYLQHLKQSKQLYMFQLWMYQLFQRLL